jgi:hypothetical protein
MTPGYLAALKRIKMRLHCRRPLKANKRQNYTTEFKRKRAKAGIFAGLLECPPGLSLAIYLLRKLDEASAR